MSKKENTKQTEFEPILFEIIEGSIESARREMEIQVERTARSSIVREQHDHRSGIFLYTTILIRQMAGLHIPETCVSLTQFM